MTLPADLSEESVAEWLHMIEMESLPSYGSAHRVGKADRLQATAVLALVETVARDAAERARCCPVDEAVRLAMKGGK